jgi:hypothetical protein
MPKKSRQDSAGIREFLLRKGYKSLLVKKPKIFDKNLTVFYYFKFEKRIYYLETNFTINNRLTLIEC